VEPAVGAADAIAGQDEIAELALRADVAAVVTLDNAGVEALLALDGRPARPADARLAPVQGLSTPDREEQGQGGEQARDVDRDLVEVHDDL